MSESFFEKLTDVCHQLLLNNEGLIHYLKVHRGMTNKTISTYKLGAFPEDLRDLYDEYDVDPVELREQNIVWNADQSQFKLYPVVIPIRKKRKSLTTIPPLLNSRIASTNFFPPAPRTIGPESKKANSAAERRFNPKNIPLEIVTPEREIPGIRAML